MISPLPVFAINAMIMHALRPVEIMKFLSVFDPEFPLVQYHIYFQMAEELQISFTRTTSLNKIYAVVTHSTSDCMVCLDTNLHWILKP